MSHRIREKGKVSKEVLDLLSSPVLQRIENTMAARVGSIVNREYVSLLGPLTEQEIIDSALTCQEVAAVLQEDGELLIEFAVGFLQKDRASAAQTNQDEEVMRSDGYAVGFGITHAIYLHYLMHRSRAALKEYLTRRRIPCAAQVVKELVEAYEKATPGLI